jgi:hypothetical protein
LGKLILWITQHIAVAAQSGPNYLSSYARSAGIKFRKELKNIEKLVNCEKKNLSAKKGLRVLLGSLRTPLPATQRCGVGAPAGLEGLVGG